MDNWGVVLVISALIALFTSILGLVHKYVVAPSNLKHDKSIEQIDKLIITIVELNTSIKSLIETDKSHATLLVKHGEKINELDREFNRLDLEFGYFKDRVN